MSFLSSLPEILPIAMDAARAALFQNAGWILAGITGGALLSDLAAGRLRDRDKRAGYLAEFLGVREDHVVPLPPASALWCLYAQRNRNAYVDAELPNGSQTLQGSYLVMTARGAAVIAVHNFETSLFYRAPDRTDDILDTIGGRASVAHGLVQPERFPVEIEFDAARRADLVTYLLKAAFRTPGDVVPMVLVRDGNDMAPTPMDEPSQAGHTVQRLSFADPEAARDAIATLEGNARVADPPAVRDWLLRWAGKVTSLRRRAWRASLLAAGCLMGAWQAGLLP